METLAFPKGVQSGENAVHNSLHLRSRADKAIDRHSSASASAVTRRRRQENRHVTSRNGAVSRHLAGVGVFFCVSVAQSRGKRGSRVELKATVSS